MQMYYVALSERRTCNTLSTYIGLADGRRDARVQCLRRAATSGKITRAEAKALEDHILWGTETPDVDVGRFVFGLTQMETS